MQLNNIKTTACPKCGCTVIVGESVSVTSRFGKPEIMKHCNDIRWESRSFLCGTRISYEPNFCREAVHGTCVNDLEHQRAMEKLKEDKLKLRQFCAENNISESLRKSMETYVLN